MPKYRLTYSNSRGWAEVCRLIFAAAGQEYEDRRIDMYKNPDPMKIATASEDLVYSEEWLTFKEKTPFGQIPILEVDDDFIIAHTRVIAAYLAKNFGLAGKDEREGVKAAMICETSYELFIGKLSSFRLMKDKNQQAEEVKKYTTETLPNMLARLEKMASDDGFFAGDQLTFADITFYHNTTLVTSQKHLPIELDFSKYPKLQKVCDNVTSNPGIAKWLKERPETRF